MKSAIIMSLCHGLQKLKGLQQGRKDSQRVDIFTRLQDRSQRLLDGWKKKTKALQAERRACGKAGSMEEHGMLRERL